MFDFSSALAYISASAPSHRYQEIPQQFGKFADTVIARSEGGQSRKDENIF